MSQLQKTFASPVHQELALRKVGSRQQAFDETILHYYNDMIELFDMIDINMSDQYKVAYLKAGLKVSLKREVMRNKSTDINRIPRGGSIRREVRSIIERTSE